MASGWNTTPHRALIRVYTCPGSNTTKHLIWKGTLVIQSAGIQLRAASLRQAKSAFKYGSVWNIRWDDLMFLSSSHSITEEQEAFDKHDQMCGETWIHCKKRVPYMAKKLFKTIATFCASLRGNSARPASWCGFGILGDSSVLTFVNLYGDLLPVLHPMTTTPIYPNNLALLRTRIEFGLPRSLYCHRRHHCKATNLMLSMFSHVFQ